MTSASAVDTAAFDQLLNQIAPRFPRREPRAQAARYLEGLLAGPLRKNGWTLARHAGAGSPDGMQRLLRTAGWDVDGLRDDVRAEVLTTLGDADGVWILDEAGFLKKGDHSAGVERQYLRSTKSIQNCQVGVFLAYASANGEDLVDRALYLPKSWTDDDVRRRRAGIPASVEFLTKPQLALQMLGRVHAAGQLHGWVSADKTYGSHPFVRNWLGDRKIPFVMATNNDDFVTTSSRQRRRAEELAADVLGGDIPQRQSSRRCSIDAGPYRGQLFDWSVVELLTPPSADFAHWMLIRQQTAPSEGMHHRKIACYLCSGPPNTGVDHLISVAAARWRSETCFEAARLTCGLDDYQVRDWRAWHAHITLAMLAAGHLTRLSAGIVTSARPTELDTPNPPSE